eukprot:scaffold98212_cov17-Tisochrysis_lutea.AAC.1
MGVHTYRKTAAKSRVAFFICDAESNGCGFVHLQRGCCIARWVCCEAANHANTGWIMICDVKAEQVHIEVHGEVGLCSDASLPDCFSVIGHGCVILVNEQAQLPRQIDPGKFMGAFSSKLIGAVGVRGEERG